jgi:phage tail tape-measure protein
LHASLCGLATPVGMVQKRGFGHSGNCSRVSADLTSDNYAKQGGWGGVVAGAAVGAKVGAGLGIAGGPLGAIAGTVPGAVVGGVIGYFSGEKMGAKIKVDEPKHSGNPPNATDVCPKCGRHLSRPSSI